MHALLHSSRNGNICLHASHPSALISDTRHSGCSSCLHANNPYFIPQQPVASPAAKWQAAFTRTCTAHREQLVLGALCYLRWLCRSGWRFREYNDWRHWCQPPVPDVHLWVHKVHFELGSVQIQVSSEILITPYKFESQPNRCT